MSSHTGVKDVVGIGIDACASDWVRALSTRHYEVEIAITDGDKGRIILTGKIWPANCLGVSVQTSREAVAIERVDGVVGEGTSSRSNEAKGAELEHLERERWMGGERGA